MSNRGNLRDARTVGPQDRRSQIFFSHDAAVAWINMNRPQGWTPSREIEQEGPRFRAFLQRPKIGVKR